MNRSGFLKGLAVLPFAMGAKATGLDDSISVSGDGKHITIANNGFRNGGGITIDAVRRQINFEGLKFSGTNVITARP